MVRFRPTPATIVENRANVGPSLTDLGQDVDTSFGVASIDTKLGPVSAKPLQISTHAGQTSARCGQTQLGIRSIRAPTRATFAEVSRIRPTRGGGTLVTLERSLSNIAESSVKEAGATTASQWKTPTRTGLRPHTSRLLYTIFIAQLSPPTRSGLGPHRKLFLHTRCVAQLSLWRGEA